MMEFSGSGYRFGDGIRDESEYEYEPKVDVSQTALSEVVRIHDVDRKCHEYDLDLDEIRKIVKGTDSYSVQVKLDYKMHGWCHFSAVGTDLEVHRLAIMNERELKCVVEALWKTVTYTPKADCPPPLVTMLWQEYAVDHFLFKHLLATGWAVTGLEPKTFRAYGEWFDGVKLERQF